MIKKIDKSNIANIKSQTNILPAVNFHLIKECNYKCKFCFAKFKHIKQRLDFKEIVTVMKILYISGVRKINFVGGEPTLHPNIGEILTEAKTIGFSTSIVSNGAKLEEVIKKYHKYIDWIGLSVDSFNEETQKLLGRGNGTHIEKSIKLAKLARSFNIKIKLNTVVTSLNYKEDMSQLIKKISPNRWKVFQVLLIKGENENINNLLITKQQFKIFIEHHQKLKGTNIVPVFENNDIMTGSYLMIDPLGRFFDNSSGYITYSKPIILVGIEKALKEININTDKFLKRGGLYRWDNKKNTDL